MDRRELVKQFDWPFEQEEAQKRGEDVRRQYVACAATFRSITECVGMADQYGTTNLIYLDRHKIRGGRSMFVWSRLHFAGGSDFGVITTFRAAFNIREAEPGERYEQFGSLYIVGDPHNEMPEFIRNPQADPNCDWEVSSFLSFGLQLEQMVKNAQKTQDMLIGALCNPHLNREKAPLAVAMFKG